MSFPYQTETKSLSKVSLLLVTCLGYSAAAMVEESSSMEHSRDGMEEGEGCGMEGWVGRNAGVSEVRMQG